MLPPNWLELYPLSGTCPICGTHSLQLEDDIWIPAHVRPHQTASPWDTLLGTGGENLRNCPIGRHTQAVEDGGVEVEMAWLGLYAQALDRRRADLECEHSKYVHCVECADLALAQQTHTDAWHRIARRWSRPNIVREHLPAGIEAWRDRRPMLPRTLDGDIRSDYYAACEALQDESPPRDDALRYMYEVLRAGQFVPPDRVNRFRLLRLRRYGFVRRARRRAFQLTPIGIYFVGKYLKGFDSVLKTVLTHRLCPATL